MTHHATQESSLFHKAATTGDVITTVSIKGKLVESTQQEI